jgi:hypothetical protein
VPAPRVVAEHIIKKYGRVGFLRLLEMFKNAEPGPLIAAEFKVSRQRVLQWKNILGQERVLYILHPDIDAFLGIPPAHRTSV